MKKAKDLCKAVPEPASSTSDTVSQGGDIEEPTEIPDPLLPPKPDCIPDDVTSNGTLVFFDIETTGFGEHGKTY